MWIGRSFSKLFLFGFICKSKYSFLNSKIIIIRFPGNSCPLINTFYYAEISHMSRIVMRNSVFSWWDILQLMCTYWCRIHIEAQAVMAKIHPATLVVPAPPGNVDGVGVEPKPGFVAFAT